MSLRFFRKKKTVRTITVITALVAIPGFIIWGISISGSQGNQDIAARVNRQDITIQQYDKAYGNAQDQYMRILGAKYQKAMQSINLQKLVLNSLIDQTLLKQEYDKMGIRVSDTEVLDAIKADPAFKDAKGNFNPEKFQQVFGRMSPQEMQKIQNQVRQKLLYRKLQQLIVGETSLTVSDTDLKPFLTPKTKPGDVGKIREYVLGQKQEKYFQDWFAKVKQNSAIKIIMQLTPQTPQTPAAVTPESPVTPAPVPKK